jgi:clathrin heavy chain
MLYACYDLIPPHVVMEISWRNGLNDFTMPYFINYMAQTSATMKTLELDNAERKKREQSQEKEESGPILGGGRLMITAAPTGRVSPAPFAQTNGFGGGF